MALQWFEDEYTSLQLRTCPDLPRQTPRFKELTTLQIEAISHAVVRGGTVQVVNRSAFPLTHVELQLRHPIPGGSRTTEAFITYLAPGDDGTIAYDDAYAPVIPPGNSKQNDRGRLSIKCDQGAAITNVN